MRAELMVSGGVSYRTVGGVTGQRVELLVGGGVTGQWAELLVSGEFTAQRGLSYRRVGAEVMVSVLELVDNGRSYCSVVELLVSEG